MVAVLALPYNDAVISPNIFTEPVILLLPLKIKLPVFFTLAERSGLTTSTAALPDCLIYISPSGTLIPICPISNDAVDGETPGVKLLMCNTFGDIDYKYMLNCVCTFGFFIIYFFIIKNL